MHGVESMGLTLGAKLRTVVGLPRLTGAPPSGGIAVDVVARTHPVSQATPTRSAAR